MPEQQFCLKWSNFHTNMSEVFHNMLQSESMVDVTIACEGASLKAHKMILAACSPFFQSLFMSNPCKHPIVILKDIKFIDLKATIDFVYKGEVNVTSGQLGSVLKTAETLKIKGLTDVVQRQRELNAREMSSVYPPKKRKRRQKPRNIQPSPLPSCDESSGENDVPVTLEERSEPNKSFPMERSSRDGGEISVNQVDLYPIPAITVIPTTEVTTIESVQEDDIIVATDHATLLENHPALRQFTYKDTTQQQHQVLPVVTVTGTNELSQLILESGDQLPTKRRRPSNRRTSVCARVHRYPDETFYESGGTLHCKACGETVNHMKVSILKYHIKSQKHQLNKKRFSST